MTENSNREIMGISIDKDVHSKFKDYCYKHHLKQSGVVEELIKRLMSRDKLKSPEDIGIASK